MPKKIIEHNLRIPAEIDRAIRKLAEANDRSINMQAVHMLRQQIPAELLDECRADLSPEIAK